MSIRKFDPRLTDVGGVPIARLSLNKGKQLTGAWCFLDHARPTSFDDNEEGMQIDCHPHTNLQTFS